MHDATSCKHNLPSVNNFVNSPSLILNNIFFNIQFGESEFIKLISQCTSFNKV